MVRSLQEHALASAAITEAEFRVQSLFEPIRAGSTWSRSSLAGSSRVAEPGRVWDGAAGQHRGPRLGGRAGPAGRAGLSQWVPVHWPLVVLGMGVATRREVAVVVSPIAC